MQTIQIFLASSAELEADRREFEIFINRKNKDWKDKGVFLELVIWEDFLDAVSPTRSQDEYNKAVRESDIFVLLFFTKVGKYTEEEFDTAYQQFKDNGKPLIFTYFKDAAIKTGDLNEDDAASYFAFRKKLKALDHFYIVYENKEGLKFDFTQQLDKLVKSGFIAVEKTVVAPPKIYISKLPHTNPTIFGREKELKLLDDAWANEHCHLLQFIAWGGAGKTGLVTHWLHSRMADGLFDGVAIYAWSFYSQGAGDHRQSTAEPFIVAILKWFGEEEMKLPNSPHDRGVLLAKHLRRQRTLLLLDGMEPLQYPPANWKASSKTRASGHCSRNSPPKTHASASSPPGSKWTMSDPLRERPPRWCSSNASRHRPGPTSCITSV